VKLAPARVGINAQLLNLSGTFRSAGISTFTYHLLANIKHAAPELDLHAFTGERSGPAISPQIEWHISRLPTRSPFARIFWEQCLEPVLTLSYKLNLLHSLAYVQPLVSPVPNIVTVYDLSFLLYPYLFRPLNRLYLTSGTRMSVRRARRVITISQSTKRDVVRNFGVAPERVVVVPCGVEEAFLAERPDPLPFQLPDKFILHIGTLEPRKNLVRLVHAFSRLKHRNLPHKLVLAGAKGWYTGEIMQAIQASDAREEIILLGYVAPEHKPALYRAADVFVFPSLYEGFGLPPLEAMASRTAVVASNASSLPEVVGEAGILVDPQDENALADALLSVLTNSALRENLRQRGYERAKTFSWSATAQSVAQVYREVLAA
jgi:glycosyltransferase involved in cell wall biosynthesis